MDGGDWGMGSALSPAIFLLRVDEACSPSAASLDHSDRALGKRSFSRSPPGHEVDPLALEVEPLGQLPGRHGLPPDLGEHPAVPDGRFTEAKVGVHQRGGSPGGGRGATGAVLQHGSQSP